MSIRITSPVVENATAVEYFDELKNWFISKVRHFCDEPTFATVFRTCVQNVHVDALHLTLKSKPNV